jgi:hypothetical protein
MDQAAKVFISYSWTNPEHEQWVVNLAEELGDSGVHAILDKFDLLEGHDSVTFMERMVTDPEVKKVLLICDEVYANKTNNRTGGVGTEAQIISAKIYESADQNKFVAILSERDDDGKPFLPVYYTTRIYIDLSSQEKYATEFEKLVRWIYDKPLYQRKPLGSRPVYLDEDPEVSLSTRPLWRRAMDAIKGGKPIAGAALGEYFKAFSENFERLRIVRDENQLWDEQVYVSLQATIPLRTELNEIFEAIAAYDQNGNLLTKVHRFFEALIPYLDRPTSVTSWRDTDFDNFRFLIYEFFLHSIAIFISHERFDLCSYILDQGYYNEKNSDRDREKIVDFTVFNNEMKTFEMRSQRLKLRYFSPVGVFMKERLSGSGISEFKIAQAEFVAYLRGEMMSKSGGDKWYVRWWPHFQWFMGASHGAFEIFARSQSKQYFERLKKVIGTEKPEDLKELIEWISETQRAPRYDYRTLNIAELTGVDKISTRS